LLGHSAAVADVAAFLASAIEERGHAINVGLVEAAALLHDIDKALPDEHPLKALGHGFAGAAWLRERGHEELAGAVENHPVTRLADDERYFDWSRGATVEERVVAYADKRAKQDVVSLDERFQEWIERHGNTFEIQIARERAEALEKDICAAAGVSPDEVRRDPWASAALDSAA
jgi:putative nucleotidyltransferase with HDIG domain